MTAKQITLSASIDGFFIRCGLGQQALHDCDDFVRRNFPGLNLNPTQTQGYCSYTVSIGNQIVQFRPPKYRLDVKITAAAKDVYGAFAPSTAFLGTLHPHGLLIYTMDKMHGICYNSIVMEGDLRGSDIRRILCEDFATFLARSWHNRGGTSIDLGVIGSSIPSRLERLSDELPRQFQRVPGNVLSQLDLINTLPKVLAHGDMIPSNIIVDPATGHLVGLVDWTEAETLPFGICLYGLEDILGYMKDGRFIYHDDAEQARNAFWTKLLVEIPELAKGQTLEAVRISRVLGILLWHGFAFDDGAIDRVVQEDRDPQEICYLETLLDSEQFNKL